MRTLFFDLDGCLVDSRSPISGAMNAALSELGLPEQKPDRLHGYIGPPLLDVAQPDPSPGSTPSPFSTRSAYGPSSRRVRPALDALIEPKAAKLEQAVAFARVQDHERHSSAVMIGDREHDVAAGKACGIATIGVTWGIGDDTELRNAGADVIVDQPQALSTHPLVKAA